MASKKPFSVKTKRLRGIKQTLLERRKEIDKQLRHVNMEIAVEVNRLESERAQNAN
ncbi:MAG: hypothetical protein ACPGQQ_04845 [Candidatus Puniceispirillaceae bacterium]